MKEKRKVWQQPKLVVLVRGKQEERVLLNCKIATNWGPAGISSCVYSPPEASNCSGPTTS